MPDPTLANLIRDHVNELQLIVKDDASIRHDQDHHLIVVGLDPEELKEKYGDLTTGRKPIELLIELVYRLAVRIEQTLQPDPRDVKVGHVRDAITITIHY